MTSLQRKVYEIVRKIPKGKVLSYSEVARLAGSPQAWRAVGNILNRVVGKWRPKIPCHRVIKSDGKVGGYRRGTKKKIALLKKEGLIIKNGKITSRARK
jgi:methylated-DNA-[protein]-cysteine S-methyltransferase